MGISFGPGTPSYLERTKRAQSVRFDVKLLPSQSRGDPEPWQTQSLDRSSAKASSDLRQPWSLYTRRKIFFFIIR